MNGSLEKPDNFIFQNFLKDNKKYFINIVLKMKLIYYIQFRYIRPVFLSWSSAEPKGSVRNLVISLSYTRQNE